MFAVIYGLQINSMMFPIFLCIC